MNRRLILGALGDLRGRPVLVERLGTEPKTACRKPGGTAFGIQQSVCHHGTFDSRGKGTFADDGPD